jgi:hypothetical protein
MAYLTWNNVFIAVLIIGTLAGFLLRKAEMVVIVVALSLSHLFTTEVGLFVTRFLRSAFNQEIPLFPLELLIFVVVLVVLSTEQYLLNNAIEFPMGIKNNFEGALWGLVATGIFLTNIFEYMEYDQLIALQKESIVASYLGANRVFFVLIPIIILMISSISRRFKVGVN